MKKTPVTLVLALSLTLFQWSCKEAPKAPTEERATHEHATAPTTTMASGPEFGDAQTSESWKHYMDLRKALVETNATEAAAAAGALSGALRTAQPELSGLAAAMASEQDVEIQRALFSEFIGASEAYFTDALSGGTLYKQYCPMAFGNKGGYWLSDVAEIRNPYFGDKMLTCGTVATTIGE